MDTSYLSVAEVFDGVRLIAKPLNGRLSRSAKRLNTIAARSVTRWLRDPKNRSIILTLLCHLEAPGTEIGIGIATGAALYAPTSLPSSANAATRLKHKLKMLSGESYGRTSPRG